MRYKKVLLVCPRFLRGRNRLAHFPLSSLGYIAEALQKVGVMVNVLDMNLGYGFNDLKNKIAQFNPDMIGFTAMTLGYKEFYKIIDEIKNIYPQVKVTLGGPHLSAVGALALQECPGIDYGIILEGDGSMAQLCLGQDISKIPGIIFRDNGRIITNKFGRFIENLDELGFPRYEAFELKKYPVKIISIVTSRGCPYECIFCYVGASVGKKFRTRSAQSVVEEIEYWYSRGYRVIFIVDDNFTLLYQRVEQFCDLLRKKQLKGLHLKITSGIRADKVDRKLLATLKEVGVDYIAFGVESASDKVLKNIKKGENIAIIEKRIQEACELDFDVDLFFLLGSPGETMEDLKLSFSLANRYPVRRAIFYSLIPFPATELLSWLEAKQYLLQPTDYIWNNASYYKNQPCFYTPEMSIEERDAAFKTAQDIYVQVRRKFIERRIKGPALFKKIFSWFYTIPFMEDTLNNNFLILKLKEFIKENSVKLELYIK